MCGRGAGTNRHPGNKRYREMLEEYKGEYAFTRDGDKKEIAKKILRKWRAQSPPGRFLKIDETGKYYDVGDKKALDKIQQALRDIKKAPALTESEKAPAVPRAELASDRSLGTMAVPSCNAINCEGFLRENLILEQDAGSSIEKIRVGERQLVSVESKKAPTVPRPEFARDRSLGTMSLSSFIATDFGDLGLEGLVREQDTGPSIEKIRVGGKQHASRESKASFAARESKTLPAVPRPDFARDRSLGTMSLSSFIAMDFGDLGPEGLVLERDTGPSTKKVRVGGKQHASRESKASSAVLRPQFARDCSLGTMSLSSFVALDFGDRGSENVMSDQGICSSTEEVCIKKEQLPSRDSKASSAVLRPEFARDLSLGTMSLSSFIAKDFGDLGSENVMSDQGICSSTEEVRTCIRNLQISLKQIAVFQEAKEELFVHLEKMEGILKHETHFNEPTSPKS